MGEAGSPGDPDPDPEGDEATVTTTVNLAWASADGMPPAQGTSGSGSALFQMSCAAFHEPSG